MIYKGFSITCRGFRTSISRTKWKGLGDPKFFVQVVFSLKLNMIDSENNRFHKEINRNQRHRSFSARVGNFRQNIYSAEDGIDWTNGYFRRNSGCSAEQKTLGIPFRTLPRKREQLGIPFRGTKQKQTPIILFPTLLWKRTQLGIPFRGTKIEANSWNSVPNHSAGENTTRNSLPCNKKQKKTLGMRFRTIPRKRNQLRTNCGSRTFQKQCQKLQLLMYRQINY